jgi:hypothetical protein
VPIPLTADRTLRVLGVRDDDADQPPVRRRRCITAPELVRLVALRLARVV